MSSAMRLLASGRRTSCGGRWNRGKINCKRLSWFFSDRRLEAPRFRAIIVYAIVLLASAETLTRYCCIRCYRIRYQFVTEPRAMRFVEDGIKVLKVAVNLESRMALTNRESGHITGKRNNQKNFLLWSDKRRNRSLGNKIWIVEVFRRVEINVGRGEQPLSRSVATVFDMNDHLRRGRSDKLGWHLFYGLHLQTVHKYERFFGSGQSFDGVVVKPVIEPSIDAQNYQSNYLDDESDFFKGVMALLLSIMLISVRWWNVRFNNDSMIMIRALVSGMITLDGVASPLVLAFDFYATLRFRGCAFFGYQPISASAAAWRGFIYFSLRRGSFIETQRNMSSILAACEKPSRRDPSRQFSIICSHSP